MAVAAFLESQYLIDETALKEVFKIIGEFGLSKFRGTITETPVLPQIPDRRVRVGISMSGVALVDTSVLVDAFKMESRRKEYAQRRAGYTWVFTTDIAQLEFKATVIEAMIYLHSQFRLVGRFTAVRDEVTESGHKQKSLRLHILHNIINIQASSFEITEREDQLLAEAPDSCCKLTSRRPIPNSLLSSTGLSPVRSTAIEPLSLLVFLRKAFEVNLPTCKRGENKSCGVEAFIRERALAPCERLHEIGLDESQVQIRKTIELIDEVAADASIDLSSSQCRSAGDCLIVSAGQAAASGACALSTNAWEWEPLSELFGLEFVRVTYNKPTEQ